MNRRVFFVAPNGTAKLLLRAIFSAAILIFAGTLAYAGSIGLTIDATFDPSLNANEQAAIDAAIANIEGNIASPNNITVSIYFDSMTGGLGESDTSQDTVSYYDYYNDYKAVATSPAQLEALASLGPAPTSEASGNPVNGNTEIIITTAEARNLGFTGMGTNGNLLVDGADYDSEISLNTSITSPPNALNGNYSLQAVATHEIDEALGIGGTGSNIGRLLSVPVGDLDLYRYSAPGVRSFSNAQTTSPYAYFSIDGGTTVLSYFNQTSAADYGDWLSNPIPGGFPVQVQDAYGLPGTDPVLGANEITAFNVIGYEVVPEPCTLALAGLGLALVSFARRRRTTDR